MILRRSVLSFVLVVTGTAASGAQVCLSRAPFTVGRIRGGGGFAAPSGGKSYSAELAIGGAHHFFAMFDGSLSLGDEADVTATSSNARIGYELVVGRAGSVSVCPFAGFGSFKATATPSPNDTAAVEQRVGARVEIGMAVGTRWTAFETLDVLPSLSVARIGSLVKGTTVRGGILASDGLQSESHQLLTATVGVLVRRRLTIAPYLEVPFGRHRSPGHLGVTATISFGPEARGL